MRTGSRLRQVPGGWLLARDLSGQPRLPDLRMAQHHIAAHRTWGCSTGLAVMLREGELTVTPGAAVDRCGRVAILGRAYTTRFTAGQETAVVLRVHGHGPAGQVLLRERAQLHDLDIPLARIGGTGTVTAGDGDRQWLRRPGPPRRLGGTLPRGYPVTGTVSQWTAHVDLGGDSCPTCPPSSPRPRAERPVVPAPPSRWRTYSAAGFDLVVRQPRQGRRGRARRRNQDRPPRRVLAGAAARRPARASAPGGAVMTTSAAPLPDPGRPLYFPGQILAADDLTAAQDVDAGLRQLHHRMLHGWGITSGLGLTGQRGDTSVSAGSGYALDAAGRELVVPAPVTMPVPPVAAGPDGNPLKFTLAIRWTPDEDAVVVDRPGACGAEGAVRRSDVPQIVWLDPAAVRVGYDIVLAVVQVQGCKLAAAPELALRRLLNPPPTPYAASGRTTPGETRVAGARRAGWPVLRRLYRCGHGRGRVR